MIHIVVAGEDDLRDGDNFVSRRLEEVQNGGQSLGGVESGVVEEDDGAGLRLAGDPFGDLPGGQLLPVQTVASGNL